MARNLDRRIKYRHVAAFVEITRQRSLKRAADVLNLTQPAISKTLAELERTLGAQLLNRGRAGVSLTREGEVFLQFAEVSLGALQQGLAGVEQVRSGGRAHIAVGALPSVAARILPAAAARFSELSPGTVLEFEDGPHLYLVDRLRAGALEVVVGRLGPPATMRGVSFTQLYNENVAFVTRPGHPLGPEPSPVEIGSGPIIYPSERAAIRPLVDRYFLAQGLDMPPNRTETVSGAFGREMTLRSDAVWIISEGVVATDIAHGRLVKLRLDTTLTLGPVGLMVRSEEEPAPAIRLFRRAVLHAVDEIAP